MQIAWITTLLSLVLVATPASAGIFGFGVSPSPLPAIPGAIDERVNAQTIDRTICVPGYARSVRPPYSVTGPLKHRLMLAQHPGERASGYELDHLVPLSLGGAPDSMRNLWLEPMAGPMNAGDKDKLEYVLWRLVCSHTVPLETAQRAIATNWIAAYRRYATAPNLARFHFSHGGAE